jgi:hypothetical protein
MRVSDRDFRSPLNCCAQWNADKAAEVYRRLRHVKNHHVRQELERDGTRYSQNEASIRKRIARACL